MIRGIWSRETVALIFLASALPLALAWLWQEGALGAGRLVAALLLGGFWQAVFTYVRAQPPSAAGAVAALMIAILAPEVGSLQFVLGVSFGFVFGELIFGGWGRSLFSPAVVAMMFLGFGFPVAAWPHLGVPVGWAAIPGALILMVFGILPWRVLAGALVVLLPAEWLGGTPVLTSAAAVVLVFLICDPATAVTTALGRWLQGLLYGGLILLFTLAWGVADAQMAVSAALLTALTAPLLDEVAIALWQALRRQRHG